MRKIWGRIKENWRRIEEDFYRRLLSTIFNRFLTSKIVCHIIFLWTGRKNGAENWGGDYKFCWKLICIYKNYRKYWRSDKINREYLFNFLLREREISQKLLSSVPKIFWQINIYFNTNILKCSYFLVLLNFATYLRKKYSLTLDLI